jgi:hypothetical protein
MRHTAQTVKSEVQAGEKGRGTLTVARAAHYWEAAEVAVEITSSYSLLKSLCTPALCIIHSYVVRLVSCVPIRL